MRIKKIILMIMMLCFTVELHSCIKNRMIEPLTDKELEDLVYKWKNDKNLDESHADYTVTASEIRFIYKKISYTIPIYGGTEAPVDFGDIHKNRKRNHTEVIHNLEFKNTKNLKTKDFLIDILKFYKEKFNIEDIDKPTVIGYEDNMAIICYDFKISGHDSTLEILLNVKKGHYGERISELVIENKQSMLFNFNPGGGMSYYKREKLREQESK